MELKWEIKTIEIQKEETNKEFDDLKKDIIIAKFFKPNLSIIELNSLNKLVLEYKQTKDKLNNQLQKVSENLENTSETIQQLLENEKEIYKNLIPYIIIEKYEEYKEFIKKDLNIINQNSNLESEAIKKESIIKNKIEELKEKIEEHNQLLSEKLIVLINNKIDAKLNELILKDKFKQLDKISQNKLFEKLASSIEEKKADLELKENKTRLLVKKIELYKIIVDRIEYFKTNIK